MTSLSDNSAPSSAASSSTNGPSCLVLGSFSCSSAHPGRGVLVAGSKFEFLPTCDLLPSLHGMNACDAGMCSSARRAQVSKVERRPILVENESRLTSSLWNSYTWSVDRSASQAHRIIASYYLLISSTMARWRLHEALLPLARLNRRRYHRQSPSLHPWSSPMYLLVQPKHC